MLNSTANYSSSSSSNYSSSPSVVLVPSPSSTESSWCGDPGRVPFANKYGDTYTSGHQVTYECHPGYHVTSGTLVLTCTTNGTWNSPLPVCKYKSVAVSVAVIGCVTGALALLVLILLPIDFILYRRRKSRGNEALQKQLASRTCGRPNAFYGSRYPGLQQVNNVQLVMWNTTLATAEMAHTKDVCQKIKPPHRLVPLETEAKLPKKKKSGEEWHGEEKDAPLKKKGNKRKVTPANSIEDTDSAGERKAVPDFTALPKRKAMKKKKKRKDYHTLNDEAKNVYVIDDNQYRFLPPPPTPGDTTYQHAHTNGGLNTEVNNACV